MCARLINRLRQGIRESIVHICTIEMHIREAALSILKQQHAAKVSIIGAISHESRQLNETSLYIMNAIQVV